MKLPPYQELLPIPSQFANHPAFAAAWENWVEHRRSIRKPLKETAARLCLRKLFGWTPEVAIRAIEHSIAGGYQGLFLAPEDNLSPHQREKALAEAKSHLRDLRHPGGMVDPRVLTGKDATLADELARKIAFLKKP